MTIFEQLKQDKIQAMKDKDDIKKNLLSTLIGESSIKTKTPTDGEVTNSIKKFIKNIEYNQSMWEDKLEFKSSWTIAQKEKDILESYLPSQLSEDIYERFILSAIVVDGCEATVKSLNQYFKEKYSGRYDGKLLNQKIKEVLADAENTKKIIDSGQTTIVRSAKGGSYATSE